MKVLLINGSPHEKGCTYTALSLIAGELILKKQYKYGKVLLWKYAKPMQPAGEEDAE